MSFFVKEQVSGTLPYGKISKERCRHNKAIRNIYGSGWLSESVCINGPGMDYFLLSCDSSKTSRMPFRTSSVS